MAYKSKYWRDFGHSSTLGQLYVYYERLNAADESLENKKLYEVAKGQLAIVRDHAKELGQSADGMRALAKAEASKEQALLSQVFGKELKIDLSDDRSVKELVDLVNEMMNLKEVYERNIATIKNSKGQKSVISFFPTYYLRALTSHWNQISEETVAKARSSKKGFGYCLQEVLTKMNESVLVPEAVDDMLTANPELGSLPLSMKDAYQELVKALQDPAKANHLYQELIKIYQLDKVVSDIKNQLASNKQASNRKNITEVLLSKRQRKSKKGVANPLYTQLGPRAGLTLEEIENLTLDLLMGENGFAVRTGQTGIKADNILTIGFDPSGVQEELETLEGVSRKANIEAFERFYQKTREFNSGFIVYFNDKNYSLNADFERRFGFSAGAPISAQTYYDVTRKVSKNARTFTGAILQTLRGAIGDSKLKDDLSAAMAQEVAVMLFDDYQTIGDEFKQGQVNAIHIMNLGNVKIPLSVFLEMFARAIENIEKDPEALVHVDIESPEILYKTTAEQIRAQEMAGQGPFWAWREQRKAALQETQISYHFWKEFSSFVRQFL